MICGLLGTVKSIDDTGQIHVAWDNGSTLALNSDDSFQAIEQIKVLLCKPDEKAKVIEIDDTLEAMQELVGGYIQEYMPWEDEVALICNEEGKMTGLPLNRGIRDENGQLQDIIAGDFFICYAPIESERFLSMPSDLMEKYKEKFDLPEMFMMDNGEIETIKYNPDGKNNPTTAFNARGDAIRDYAR